MLPVKQQFYVRRRALPSVWETIRHFSEKDSSVIGEDLIELMHGRKNLERRDSVSNELLLERQAHQLRIKSIVVNKASVRLLTSLGIGSKKRRHAVYKLTFNQFTDVDAGSYKKSQTGSGGFAVHVASASKDWPIFTHLLPEIAFAGHSNCGKSTLVNSMVGVAPKKGPAAISNRAGWTDQICFYQLGKKPPVFTVSDLPGYGHAVATEYEKRFWKLMIRDYLGTRQIISRCCVLVDCTRGLCAADYSIITFLNKVGVDWKVVLTKCDLMNAEDVARSIAAVDADLIAAYPFLSPTHALSSTIPIQSSHEENEEEVESKNKSSRDEDSDVVISENGSENGNNAEGIVIESRGGSDVERERENESETEIDMETLDGEDGRATLTTSDREESEDENEDENPDTNDGVSASTDMRTGDTQLLEGEFSLSRRIIPVSSSTGAGIQRLWTDLVSCAKASVSIHLDPNPASVKEHKHADLVRRSDLVRQLQKIKKEKSAKEKKDPKKLRKV